MPVLLSHVIPELGAPNWAQSSWLGGPDARLLRKNFTMKAAGKAVLSASGAGFFEVYVNGTPLVAVCHPYMTGVRAGGETAAITGAWTTYNTRVLYWTYELDLPEGENVISVMIGRYCHFHFCCLMPFL